MSLALVVLRSPAHLVIKPPEWNLYLVLRSLTWPPLKLSTDRHLTWKTYVLLALPLAKWVCKLLSLSYWGHYSKGWRSCTFLYLPGFIPKMQNLSVYDPGFEEFTNSSMADFVDEDRDKMLLCPIGAPKKYLSRTEQFSFFLD